MRMTSAVFVFTFLSVCGLSACSNEASHLPSPLGLPGAIAGSVFENATYGARRTKVKNYVAAHYQILGSEARSGQGVHLEEAMGVAGISAQRRPQVRKELMDATQGYFSLPATDNSVEKVVVVLMVHSG